MYKLSFLKKSVLAKVVIPLLFVAIASTSCTNITEYIFRNTFTVTFYANGGTGKMEDQTFTQDKEQALSKNAFIAPDGRVFAGWATDQNDGIKIYDDNQYIKVTKNLELYALWKMDEGSGTATETKKWLFDGYIDEQVRPGNDFYKYSIGSWLNDANGVGVWKNVQNHESDDTGVMGNQKTIGKEFVQDMFLEVNEYNKDNPLIKRTAELYPNEDETEKLDHELAAIKNKLAQIDKISDVDSFRAAYLDAFMYQEPLWGIASWIKTRTEKTFSVSASNWYAWILSNAEDNAIDLNNLFYLNDKNLFDGKEITTFRQLYGFDESNKAEEDAFIKTIIDFVLASAEEYDSDVTGTAMEDALFAYLKNLGIDTTNLNFVSREAFNNLSLVGAPGYDSLSIENAKTVLKFLIARYDLNLLFDRDSTVRTFPYVFTILKAYKDRYDPDGKKRDYVVNMCEEFRETFRNRLQNNTWMSSSTKKSAIKKLDEMYFFCGYPEKFPEEFLYKDLNFDSYDTYVSLYEAIARKAWLSYLIQNTSNGNEVTREQIEIDSSIWSDPLEANAMYSRGLNTVIILLTNLFDPICNTDYPDAYNYAILGATTIGHEMCHAFDAYGSKYNENGHTKDWWAISDKLRYEDKKAQMAQLYSMFTLDSDSFVNINGEQTLDENMADFGGLTVAYDLFVSKKIKEGFSGEELIKQKKMFFQAFGIGWTGNYDEELYERIIKLDVHSPRPFRVNGCVCLMDDWYDLYDVQPGDKYYLTPGQRVILW